MITGHKTWVHHYHPLTKRQSTEWQHQSLPCKKKFKVQTSAGKVMATVFWESEGNLLVKCWDRGATFNSERCVLKLKQQIQNVQSNRKMN
jgi:hypothetical protein